MPKLTPRETQVVALVAEALTNKQIAARLGITEGSVKEHVRRACRKKNLHNRTDIAVWYVLSNYRQPKEVAH